MRLQLQARLIPQGPNSAQSVCTSDTGRGHSSPAQGGREKGSGSNESELKSLVKGGMGVVPFYRQGGHGWERGARPETSAHATTDD